MTRRFQRIQRKGIRLTELDFEMGKLSQEDYDRMRKRFEARALEAMEALDSVTSRS